MRLPTSCECAFECSTNTPKPCDPACDELDFASMLEDHLLLVVQAGDALYIPEGWWHQIDSDGLTIAVSHWWEGPATIAATAASPDAGSYHLRRLLRAEVERRTARLLASIAPFEVDQNPSLTEDLSRSIASNGCVEFSGGLVEGKVLGALAMAVKDFMPTQSSPAKRRRDSTGDSSGPQKRQRSLPSQVAALRDTSGGSDQLEDEEDQQLEPSASSSDDGSVESDADELGLHDDVARLFATLTPDSLQNVLGLMGIAFPRTIQAVLLHALRPAAAELLTQKLERADEALLRAGKHVEQVRPRGSLAMRCMPTQRTCCMSCRGEALDDMHICAEA